MGTKNQISILLADDDADDTFFFARALKNISVPTLILTVQDGEMLIEHLTQKDNKLPDILFLDINMPRKNGMECLTEIRENKKTALLPVIIYSTSLNKSVADIFYDKGAFYYLRKGDFNELVENLEFILTKFQSNGSKRPARDKFIFNLQKV